MVTRRLLLGTCGVAALSLVVGCTKEKAQARAPVSGEVSYQGKPLAGGQVVFIHAASGYQATAEIGPDGKFHLDAEVGPNQVGVIYREPSQPANDPGLPGATLPGKPLIPAHYLSPGTSGVTIEVQAGANKAQITLK